MKEELSCGGLRVGRKVAQDALALVTPQIIGKNLKDTGYTDMNSTWCIFLRSLSI